MPFKLIGTTPMARSKPRSTKLFVRCTAGGRLLTVSVAAVKALGVPETVGFEVDESTARMIDGSGLSYSAQRRLYVRHAGQVGCKQIGDRLPLLERVPCKLVWRYGDGELAEEGGGHGSTPGLEFPIQPAEEPNA